MRRGYVQARTVKHDQARFLLGYLRSRGIEPRLLADHDGVWLEWSAAPGVRFGAEVQAQVHALRDEIADVLYALDTRPIRLAGRRALA